VSVVLEALYVVSAAALYLYGLNAYVLIAIHWWNRQRAATPAAPAPPLAWPSVTVQLPLFNERYVARRLLETVGRLDYPPDRLEIQVLDDSTDATSVIVAEAVRQLRQRGLTVVHLDRRERTGFKAGALAAGLKEARGEFVAIFDADAVPPSDFLRTTLAHFTDARVAVVQTRWEHLNRDFSLLTMAQSLGIDGHFGVEQSARSWGKLLLNFNGTAGVWRKAAIEDAGGWTHDTLTEDLDLSYRAQLRGWRIVYRPDLVCPAELPVLITGFKSQQRRWAKGSIQTALKLLPALARAPLSPWVKYQAFIHLTYYTIHPALLVGVLLSAPLLGVTEVHAGGNLLLPVTLALTLGLLGPAVQLLYAQHVVDPRWRRHVWRLPTIMIIGTGLAWSTSVAVLDAVCRRDLEFVRTPKFGIGPAGGDWRGKAYAGRRPWGGVVELALGLYCAWSTWLFGSHASWAATPFLALYATGFVTVGALTLLHGSSAGDERSTVASGGSP
jgi:cellulose synthase/poly-beta-1,6-N-acetylglucosamine synthase-like glycosyltransferase